MITYTPFQKTFNRFGITTYEIIKSNGISSSMIHRLRHNLPVDTNTLDRLCKALYCCSISDVVEYIPDKQF